jgi:hypothetical protein
MFQMSENNNQSGKKFDQISDFVHDHKKTIGWTAGGLAVGAVLGYTGYASMNNQVVFSGSGLALTKSKMMDKMTDSSSTVLFSTAKAEALQKLYPEDALKSDTKAKEAGDKLIAQYIKNNGGEATLEKTLKAQGTTLTKWKQSVSTQATAQAKSNAQQKQAVKVIEEAGLVTSKSVNKAVKNYQMYVTNAYLSKDEDTANKVADAIRNSKDVSSDDYTQHQDDLKVSSIDSNSDSATVLSKLKDAKKGDVVVVQLSSGSGYYVFQLKDSYSYDDYKKNNDNDGLKQVRSAVQESLNEQAAQSSSTLGKAEAKVFKKHDLHFKSKSLDDSFYSSLTSSQSTSLTSGATSSDSAS